MTTTPNPTAEQIERAAKEWHESGNGVGSWARSSQHHREIVRKRAARMLTVAGIAPQEPSDFGKSATVATSPKGDKAHEKLIAEAEAHWVELNGLNSRAAEVMMELADLAAQPVLDESKVADLIEAASMEWQFKFDLYRSETGDDPGPKAEYIARALCEAAKQGELT